MRLRRSRGLFQAGVLFVILGSRLFTAAAQRNEGLPATQTAKQAMSVGNVSQAETVLEAIVKKKVADPEPYNLLGEIRVRQQRLSEAERLFQKSIAVSPTPGAYENLVLLEALAGNDASSKSASRKLLLLQPGNYNGRLVLALAYINESSFGDALRTLQPLRHDPDPLLQAIYAVALDHTGEHAGATRIREDLASRPISSQDALLAMRLFRAPELKEISGQWLSQASQKSSGPALVQIADAYRRDANWEEAAKLYLQALNDSLQSVSLLLSLATVEEKSGHHAEAVEHLQSAKVGLQNEGDWRAYALACMQLSFMQEAAGALQKTLDQNGPNAESYFLLGVIQFYFGKYDQAEECYNLALKQTPDNLRVRLALGYLWVETHDFEKATRELKAAQQNTQLAGLAHYYLGLIEKTKGSLPAASQELNLAVKLRPNDPMIRADLADVQISLGKLDSARANLDAALRLDSRSAKTHFQNARLLSKMKKSDEAKAELALSQKLQESERDRAAMQLAEAK